MGSKKWTYHKERSFANNFLFLKVQELTVVLTVDFPNAHIHTFRRPLSFI